MNQIVGFEIGILTDLINKVVVIKRTQKINSEYFNQKKKTTPQGNRSGGQPYHVNKKRFNQPVGTSYMPQQSHNQREASNAHRARSVVRCIMGIASMSNQAALSSRNLDISQGIVGILPTTKPNRTA
jgi:hypothetical protein